MKPLVRLTPLALCAAALLLAGCKRHQPPAHPAPDLPVATVQTLTIESSSETATEETVGTIQPRLQARIEAKIAGRIEVFDAEPGRQVKSGDLLVRLDAQAIRARLDQALATGRQADADLKRYTALLELTAVTQAEFDAVQTRAQVAQAAVAEAKSVLAHAEVTAPFDGTVTRKFADVGDLAAPGKPLLELEDPSSLRFQTDVPQALIHSIQSGATLPVRISGISQPLPGAVSEIAPAADPASRTFRVKLDLPPTDGLRSGLFGRVAIPTDERTAALRVPQPALVRRGQLELLFVVEQNRARMRLVKTGRRTGDLVEIASGLSPGESIVIEGAASLTDGQPVILK